ncbi:hypothetical protein F52700_5369 [Fusarium sp. NRRL 52700]|nr:hypothetical protein F52700_5369 [Fusarium sp. NRRL 52700]
MVNINLAYSAPINPSGVSPILSEAEIWNGLRRKVRKAHEFVAPILHCEVLGEEQTESGTKVTRQVMFDKEARGSNDNVVKEVVYEFAPTRVDFYQPDGSKIFNTVEGEPARELRDKYFKVSLASTLYIIETDMIFQMAKGAVEGTIVTIRKLVKGKLRERLWSWAGEGLSVFFRFPGRG